MMLRGSRLKIIMPLSWVLLSVAKLPAQGTADADYLIDSSSIAKILLHFDKPDYFAGDTIFFKAYIYADYAPNLISKNLFAGLYSDSGKLVITKHFPVLGGVCSGDMELPDSLAHGRYYFQVFTPQQLNAGDSLAGIKSLYILNPKNVPGKFREAGRPAYGFQMFFPGGQMVEGVTNRISFKATDRYGHPVPVEGKLVEDGAETLLEFSGEQGAGSFYFLPEQKKYTAVITFPGGSVKKYDLPEPRPSGLLVTVTDNHSNKDFLIEAHFASDKEEKNLQLLGAMNGRLVFRQPLSFTGHLCSGKIPASRLPSGILQLAVADKSGKPLGTAITFINNREYLKEVQLKTDSLDFSINGRNQLRISFPDTLIASLSISVTDNRYSGLFNSSANNIIADALLQSENLSFEPLPDFVPADTSLRARNQVEWLLQTGHWLTPDWKALYSEQEEAGKLYDTSYISISGKVFKEGSNKPQNGGALNFMINTKDSIKTFVQVPVAQDGSFSLLNLVYEDSASFSYGMNKGKGGLVSLVLDPPGKNFSSELFRGPGYNEFGNDRLLMIEGPQKENMDRLFSLLNDSSGKYKILQEITVQAKKRNPTMLVNQRYATGLFSNMVSARVLDFINDPPASGAGNIFDYLQGRLAGVMISRKGGKYVIEAFRGLSISNMTMGGNGLIDGKIFLNDFEVTSDDVAFIPLRKIALVKYFPPGTILLPNVGTAPVLAVYTKEGEDLSNTGRTFLQSFRYPGYSRSHLDFDYDSGNSSGYSGRRGTLLWQPDLFLNGENREIKIPFVNLTGAGEIRILIQGVTSDGEFIYLDKIISRSDSGKGF